MAAMALAGSSLATSPAWAAEAGKGAAQAGDLVTVAASGLQAESVVLSTQAVGTSNPKLSSRVTTSEYSGSDRYATAASIAKAAFPDGSPTAVIVGGESGWPDALTAACLAASQGPILPVGTSTVPSDILQVISELGVTSVVIVGGLSVVGAGVQVALEKAGVPVANQKRLFGRNRQETQLAMFNYGVENNLWSDDLIILASGKNFPDALAASPVSYAMKAPIFILGDDGTLSADQKEAWRNAAEEGLGKRVIVVGGSAAVPDAAKAFADEMRALANGSGESERLSGANRYETSVAMGKWAVDNCDFSWNGAAFSTGLKPWDALTGSVLQGVNRSVLLLADSMGAASVSAMKTYKSSVTELAFFGGKSSLVPSVRMSLADALGFPVAALPNFKLYLDAGHGPDNGSGSYDSGALGVNGAQEYVLTKELVNKIAPLLKAEGVDVFVNDDGGYYKLRHAEAVSLGCDAILSIHFNAGGGSGYLSLIHSYNANEYSRTWQSKIHPSLTRSLGSLRDRGQLTQEVAILGGKLPAVLLETCFIDSSRDMSTYQSRKETVATEIAKAIMS